MIFGIIAVAIALGAFIWLVTQRGWSAAIAAIVAFVSGLYAAFSDTISSLFGG